MLSHVPLKTFLARAIFCGEDGDDLHMDAMVSESIAPACQLSFLSSTAVFSPPSDELQ